MSTFDPNNDYAKDQQQESLYMTVVEVQKVLQEITALLHMNEQQQQQRQRPLESQELLIPDLEPEEELPTIYDDIFQ